MIGYPTKLVLHTVEAPATLHYSYNPSSYFGYPYWPHATIDSAGIYQHLPIDVSAFGLYHVPGRAETNRANAVQCDIMGRAANIDDLPDATWDHLADWLSWCATQTGTPIVFAEFRGAGSAGEDAPQRFSDDEWLAFSGICGHQHVPGNDHWDPGGIDVGKLAALMGGSTPTITKEIPVNAIYLDPEGTIWWWDSAARIHTSLDTTSIVGPLMAAGTVDLGRLSEADHGYLFAVGRNAGFTG